MCLGESDEGIQPMGVSAGLTGQREIFMRLDGRKANGVRSAGDRHGRFAPRSRRDLDSSRRAVFVFQLNDFKLKLQSVVARRWYLPTSGFKTSNILFTLVLISEYNSLNMLPETRR